MKRKWILSLSCVLFAMLLFGCGTESGEENITFTGEVQEVNDGSVLVSTTDDVGFDLATVRFEEGAEPDFTLAEGQTLRITILPQIAESYPVQVTAVSVELLSDAETLAQSACDVSRAA